MMMSLLQKFSETAGGFVLSPDFREVHQGVRPLFALHAFLGAEFPSFGERFSCYLYG